MKRDLPFALLEIANILNSPRYDDILLQEAGVALDRALFPLLVRLDAHGPVSIADLAGAAGRDHSTVSRQIAKLESLGLVARKSAAGDQRVRAAAITPKGRAVAAALSAARDRLYARLLDGWTKQEREVLTRLNRKLADTIRAQADQALAEMATATATTKRARRTI